MTKIIPYAVSIMIAVLLSACATGQSPVIERMDELTAVTITNSRTPIVMSPNTPYEGDAARDYLQVGVIEVNRMGDLHYYLWLGISTLDSMSNENTDPEDFESVEVVAGNETFQLDVHGWTPAAIGASEPVYNKLFRSSSNAYYRVTLEQIQLLAETDDLKLYSTGSEREEFVPWYKQETARNDLTEFLESVRQ